MRRSLVFLALVFFLFVTGFTFYTYYEFIFARRVEGVIVGIQRVTEPIAILGGGTTIPTSQIYSFAVAVKEASGEIVTASSEDRQWAVVKEGQCVQARFYPYPFWILDKAGTYHGARILRLEDCPARLQEVPPEGP